MSTHTNKLISSDVKVRLDALARLHKEVEKGTKFRFFFFATFTIRDSSVAFCTDKNIVNTFLHTGVLNKLLDMRIDPSKVPIVEISFCFADSFNHISIKMVFRRSCTKCFVC